MGLTKAGGRVEGWMRGDKQRNNKDVESSKGLEGVTGVSAYQT